MRKSQDTLGSGCGSVDRAAFSVTRGPRFESSHRQNFKMNIFSVNCWKDEKKKRPQLPNFLHKSHWYNPTNLSVYYGKRLMHNLYLWEIFTFDNMSSCKLIIYLICREVSSNHYVQMWNFFFFGEILTFFGKFWGYYLVFDKVLTIFRTNLCNVSLLYIWKIILYLVILVTAKSFFSTNYASKK